MKKLLIVAGVIMLLFVVSNAQTLPDKLQIPVPHVHNEAALIDGAKNPELIPDITAYRLFFVAVADAANATEGDKARHVLQVKRIGFADADRESFANLMKIFRAEYDDLIKSYNDEVQIDLLDGTAPDINAFLAKRDALVQGLRDELKTTLSDSGMTQLNTHIQIEKTRMKIQPATSSTN